MMNFIQACGWCEHWGNGKGPGRIRYFFYDDFGDPDSSYLGQIAEGLVKSCKVATVPENSLPCVKVCATTPFEGLGCPSFSFRGGK